MTERLCSIKEVHHGQSVVDGAGVKINRLVGSFDVEDIDPFVLLDEIRSDDPGDYLAGFPTHPHRGIETITYMIRGGFRHRDSRGGGGLLTDGCVQWMTAGKGILHSEMPEQSSGELWGYQLWLSLPKKHKMVEPRYQHLSPADILTVDEGGTSVRVISGSYRGSRGPASNWVRTHYFDVRLADRSRFEFDVDPQMSCFLYTHSGGLKICGDETGERALVRLERGSRVEVEGASSRDGFLFVAGVPNDEPIVRGGPFVMNTEEEIRQAFADYRSGNLF
jgi:redox-sensitive bicupin YhaK (pirin superfamily)